MHTVQASTMNLVDTGRMQGQQPPCWGTERTHCKDVHRYKSCKMNTRTGLSHHAEQSKSGLGPSTWVYVQVHFSLTKSFLGQVWWHTLVIPALWEAKVGGLLEHRSSSHARQKSKAELQFEKKKVEKNKDYVTQPASGLRGKVSQLLK